MKTPYIKYEDGITYVKMSSNMKITSNYYMATNMKTTTNMNTTLHQKKIWEDGEKEDAFKYEDDL